MGVIKQNYIKIIYNRRVTYISHDNFVGIEFFYHVTGKLNHKMNDLVLIKTYYMIILLN